jgi:site-specific DNA-cytosine methylase
MRAITTMPAHTAVRRQNRETGQGENNASAQRSRAASHRKNRTRGDSADGLVHRRIHARVPRTAPRNRSRRAMARASFYDDARTASIRQTCMYNALGAPIAAGVLYPLVGLLLNPMIASAAMSFSSVSVITNALRLRKLAL